MTAKFSTHLQNFSNTDEIERELKAIEQLTANGGLNDKAIRGQVKRRLNALSSKYPNDADFTPDQGNRLGRLRIST